jgi:hypothetical protein
MSKGFLYVAETLTASTEKFENINLSNLAFSTGCCETYSECALFASSKINASQLRICDENSNENAHLVTLLRVDRRSGSIHCPRSARKNGIIGSFRLLGALPQCSWSTFDGVACSRGAASGVDPFHPTTSCLMLDFIQLHFEHKACQLEANVRSAYPPLWSPSNIQPGW